MDEVSYHTDITELSSQRDDTDMMQEEQQVYKELMPCVRCKTHAGWAYSMHLAVIHTVIIVGTLGEIPTAGCASRSGTI